MAYNAYEEVSRAPVSHAKKSKYFRTDNFDTSLFLLVLLILGVGLLCLFSASHAYANYFNDGDSFYYIKRQILFAIVGIIGMLIVSIVDYHIFKKLAIWLYGISVVLLIIVLALPASNGVHRWIPVPIIGQFQPSEVAKFAIIIFMSQIISLNYKKIKSFKTFLVLLVVIGIICGLTLLEPHLSGTMLILGIGIILLYVGGCNGRHMLLTLILGGAALVFMLVVLKYEHDRIEVWMDPMGVYANDRDQAWQTVQSLFAIGSGGFMGLGLGNSRQKHLFLPEPQNDFIFSVICEELGFVGALIIILLFVLLVWKGLSIAKHASDKFGSLVAVGITSQIFIQVLLNIAVVSNFIPNTGIGLPFFSYGGTSMMMLLGEMGVLMSISRQSVKNKRQRDKE